MSNQQPPPKKNDEVPDRTKRVIQTPHPLAPRPVMQSRAHRALTTILQDGGLGADAHAALTAAHQTLSASMGHASGAPAAPTEQDPEAMKAEHDRLTDEADDDAPPDQMKSEKSNPLHPMKKWAMQGRSDPSPAPPQQPTSRADKLRAKYAAKGRK